MAKCESIILPEDATVTLLVYSTVRYGALNQFSLGSLRFYNQVQYKLSCVVVVDQFGQRSSNVYMSVCSTLYGCRELHVWNANGVVKFPNVGASFFPLDVASYGADPVNSVFVSLYLSCFNVIHSIYSFVMPWGNIGDCLGHSRQVEYRRNRETS